MTRIRREVAFVKLLEAENLEGCLVTVLGTLKGMCQAAFEGNYQFVSMDIDALIEALESDRVSKVSEKQGLRELRDQLVKDLRTIKDNTDQETVTL